ncbi:MAG: hypothetical protein R3A47_09940 [Polyangiales bacterium]
MKRYLIAVCAAATMFYGCGDDSGGSSGGTEVENAQAAESAQQSAQQAGEMRPLIDNGTDDAGGLAAVFNLYGGLTGTVTPLVAGNFGALTAKGGGSTSGTITVSGDTISFNAYQIDYITGTLSVNGSMTVTATSVDGNLDYAIDISYGGQSVSVDLSADFNSIVLDNNGCPTGGSLDIDYSYPQLYDASVRAEYGPACGDVTLFQ